MAMLQWAVLAAHIAPLYELPPELVIAIVYVESKGVPDAVSHAGAVGLMQIMPKEAGAQFADRPEKRWLLNPVVNMGCGCEILRNYIRYYNGDVERGVMAYFAGPGNVPKEGVVTHTGAVQYLGAVKRAADKLCPGHRIWDAPQGGRICASS